MLVALGTETRGGAFSTMYSILPTSGVSEVKKPRLETTSLHFFFFFWACWSCSGEGVGLGPPLLFPQCCCAQGESLQGLSHTELPFQQHRSSFRWTRFPGYVLNLLSVVFWWLGDQEVKPTSVPDTLFLFSWIPCGHSTGPVAILPLLGNHTGRCL